MNKPTETAASYHLILQEINDDIANLKLNSGTMTESQKQELLDIAEASDRDNRFNVSEVDRQYELVKHIRKKILDNQNNILELTAVKDISALVSSINSLISLFLKAQKEINHARDTALLKESVMAAIATLGPRQQEEFFETLERNSEAFS
jgi:flagellar biosynthesis chaperone FliJ